MSEKVVLEPMAAGTYDSLYIVRINYANGSIEAQFERDREGLNGLPTTCPG